MSNFEDNLSAKDIISRHTSKPERGLLPGPSRRLAPVIKCRRFLSFFQRYIVRDIPLTRDISVARYFWEFSLAH